MLARIRKLLGVSHQMEDGQPDPIVSFILIVYDMPDQARNTLLSLLPDYQQGANVRDYEVIVVENESPHVMDEEFIRTLPSNFSYHRRQESQPTPVHAINFGSEIARGENICLMIDGARLLTPGVVRNIIQGHRMLEQAVVTVPGYHLGRELQQEAVNNGYGVEEEQRLVRGIEWPVDGYRLFDIACFSGSSVPGFFLPNSESNCISIPRDIWIALGGCDPRFDMRGGGLVNLDLYKRACEYPAATHVILPGEGTFHQFHGGVTTGGEAREARNRFLEEIKAQYRELRGEEYASPITNPVYLGKLPEQAHRFLYESSIKKLQASGEFVPVGEKSGPS